MVPGAPAQLWQTASRDPQIGAILWLAWPGIHQAWPPLGSGAALGPRAGGKGPETRSAGAGRPSWDGASRSPLEAGAVKTPSPLEAGAAHSIGLPAEGAGAASEARATSEAGATRAGT